MVKAISRRYQVELGVDMMCLGKAMDQRQSEAALKATKPQLKLNSDDVVVLGVSQLVPFFTPSRFYKLGRKVYGKSRAPFFGWGHYKACLCSG
jgi:hypothetical protein